MAIHLWLSQSEWQNDMGGPLLYRCFQHLKEKGVDRSISNKLEEEQVLQSFQPCNRQNRYNFRDNFLPSAWRLKRADGTKFHNLCLKKSIVWTTNCTYLQSTKLQTRCEKVINIVSMYDLWRLSLHESWCNLHKNQEDFEITYTEWWVRYWRSGLIHAHHRFCDLF